MQHISHDALAPVVERLCRHLVYILFFFFNDTATTEIYTLSLHDALPICPRRAGDRVGNLCAAVLAAARRPHRAADHARSEEHTSELQSQSNLVCRLLLEKKKKIIRQHMQQSIQVRAYKCTL